MAECDFHEKSKMYSNLNPTPSMNSNLGKTKSMELKIILLLRLKKKNQWAKYIISK